jgi:hypothetical protein
MHTTAALIVAKKEENPPAPAGPGRGMGGMY